MTTLLPGNILYGGPIKEFESTNYKSVGHLIIEKCKNLGNRTIMIDAVDGKEYSAQYFYTSITRLVHVLKHLGVKSNDVVGLSSENCVEYAITLFAAFAVNATVAPLNVTYSEREVHHALNLSKPKVIFASKIAIYRITQVAKRNSFVEKIIVFGSTSSCPDVYSFKELMSSTNIPSQDTFECPNANKREDVALIACSSGTTGLPKGVQLTQNNIFSIIDLQRKSSIYATGTKMLTVIPWFHMFGCISLITAVNKGAVLVYLPRFHENLFLSAIEKYRVSICFMVPPLMVFLAKHPIVDKYDLSSLTVLTCGAAPLSKEITDKIKKRIGVPTFQGYGLSEATSGLLVQNRKACKPGSVGALRKGVYAKVIDPDSGKLLGPNERGELCFKGDCIMKGYVGDTKSTQTAIADEWLHTGDIGYYDDDFEFFIVDRIKELIKYKGFQVPPAEIEALLLTNTKIKDAAVIGKPDEEAGELPMAFVVKQANVQITEQEVMDFVAEHASPTKKLRGGVMFVEEIPKNPSGKILRRVLRDIIKEKTKSKL